MCCLKYENDCYVARRREQAAQKRVQAPHPGGRVVTAEGDGKVISINAQRRSATILLDDGKTMVAPWEDVLEREEGDLADVAALAAIAMMQTEEAGAQEPHRRPKSAPRPGRPPRRDGGEGPRHGFHTDGTARDRESRAEKNPRGDGHDRGRSGRPGRLGAYDGAPRRGGERPSQTKHHDRRPPRGE